MKPENETATEAAARMGFEAQCANIGRVIGSACPQGVGFVLMMFNFGGKGSFAYVSNANRNDVVTLLGEAKQKIGGQ